MNIPIWIQIAAISLFVASIVVRILHKRKLFEVIGYALVANSLIIISSFIFATITFIRLYTMNMVLLAFFSLAMATIVCGTLQMTVMVIRKILRAKERVYYVDMRNNLSNLTQAYYITMFMAVIYICIFFYSGH